MFSCMKRPIFLLTTAALMISSWTTRLLQARSIQHPLQYPRIDVRHASWPLARMPLERPVHRLHCFSEMSKLFAVPGDMVTYRLDTHDRLANGLCLVRIPTRTRATVVTMGTNNPKSSVSFIAGSSDVHMPLRTAHIHADQNDQYGPWHIACQRAYLVFRSRSSEPEWVQFRLEPEAEADKADDRRADCAADGHNYAAALDLQY